MVFDIEMIKRVYAGLPAKIDDARKKLGHPLTLTEKILFSHLSPNVPVENYARAVDYVDFAPDRVAMQDATAQMALLQLMNSGRKSAAVPSTVHCDHLIQAYKNASTDLQTAKITNEEVFNFLRDVSNKFGIGFWKPGSGIIHQVVLENYAFPGGMMVGTDSHTPNAGGLGMVAIGVGGADAVDVMAGLPWELKMPKIIGVKLTGKLSGWASPKDIILKLAGILTVKGGTNAIIEYFGEGVSTFSATGKGTICNMGAEVGATTSIFPFDQKSAVYLEGTGRKEVADEARKIISYLQADPEGVANPGSEKVRYTAERDGVLQVFEEAGAVIMANACGPCIGQWKRDGENDRPNSIVNSFNRNFAKRNDGNPNTHAFVTSPELVTAFAISGDLAFNPLKDTLTNDKGEQVKLVEPKGYEMPPNGYEVEDAGYLAPSADGNRIEVYIDPDSTRLQKLAPFAPWDGNDYIELPLLIKVAGKCTTDHISMAGSWLRFRGHLDNISDNMLIGAVNEFNNQTNSVLDAETGEYSAVPALARKFKAKGLGSVVVAEENYGEGSSREHAAMEPRFLNVKAILVKSFARIHETNLKKQGMLALTFVNKDDYNKVQERDNISILGLTEFAPGKNLKVVLHHADGSKDEFEVAHTYNEQQIGWFKAGSALNGMK